MNQREPVQAYLVLDFSLSQKTWTQVHRGP